MPGVHLTPTANLHGCAVATDIGAGTPGTNCSSDNQCRSGNCFRDQRYTGPPQNYCSDLCGSNAYCGPATNVTCQAYGADTARCLRLGTNQTRGVGVACNDTAFYCRHGDRSCITVATNNRICSAPCCRNADCPNGYFCSIRGNASAGPTGGVNTVPMCWPNGAGAHDRPAGAACTANGQCASEFCDDTLRVCVELCCHDGTCPGTTSCEDALLTRPDNGQTFGRVCLNQSPQGALRAIP